MRLSVLLATSVIAFISISLPVMAGTTGVLIGIADSGGAPGSTVQVPVLLTEGQGVGGLDFVLAYDPSVLSVESVASGQVNRGILEANTSVPGLISVSLADVSGMAGPGSVAIISFKVTGQAGQLSELALSNLQAFDAASLDELQVSPDSGVFTVTSAASGSAATSGSQAGGESLFIAIIAVGLAAGILRGRKL